MLRKLFGLLRTTKPPVVVIVGPTASGKTGFSLRLARELIQSGKRAEIISADSRQIYREIPIFSAAVTEAEIGNIPHHLVGTETVRDTNHTASWFVSRAEREISRMHQQERIPIVVGGSAFWIQGLLFTNQYPEVPPNAELRQELEQCSLAELQTRLQRLDPERLDAIDQHNPRRLIRSIEIANHLGSVPSVSYLRRKEWNTIVVHLNPDKEQNNQRISQGVQERFEQGLIAEAEQLRIQINQERMQELGLAYKHIYDYWDGDLDQEKLIARTIIEEQRYAKRQRTFLSKMIGRWSGRLCTVTTDQEKTNTIETVKKWLGG